MMHDEVITYTDGGARGNPGKAAIGVVIIDKMGKPLLEHGECIGVTTNNVAEYTALITALILARKFTTKRVTCYADSELLVRQLTGVYAVKAAHLKELFAKVREYEKNFSFVKYVHVPREHAGITRADVLVNDTLDMSIRKH